MTGSANKPVVSPDGDSSASSSLLSGLRAHAPDAWRRMATLYTPLIFRWCLRAGIQTHPAEDVVQEVFRTVAARVGDFSREQPGSTFRGWLWTVTRYKLGDYFRQLKTHPQAAGGSDALERWHELEAAEDPSSADSADDDLGDLCRRALAMVRVEFRDTTWQAFWSVVVEGQEAADVASNLGLSVNAVYLAKSRILRRLRAVLGDQDE